MQSDIFLLYWKILFSWTLNLYT